MFVFFFQAEDGIRDYKVTGVQTCALPICAVEVVAALPVDLERDRLRCAHHRPVDEHLLVEAVDGEAVACTDRKSVRKGKSVAVGGRRRIEKRRAGQGGRVDARADEATSRA